jgi:hypothetical protein
VLHLREQVEGSGFRRRRRVGDDDQLRRAGSDSIPTSPKRRRFPSSTEAFPGPTTMSTAGMDAVPMANAATAWAPPTA